MEKITSLAQMRMAAAEAKNFSAQVAAAALEAIEEIEASKQDKLPGSAGQFVGFDQGGNAVPVPPPVRGVTQAEYDALPEAERKTGLFIITDAKAAGSDGVSKEYVDGLVNGKQDKITGTAGQVAGFDADGNLTAVDGGSGGVSQEYVDNLVGSIGTLLDAINGEVV